MNQKGFIIKSILTGICLGLMVVSGFFFYPKFWALYKTSIPQITKKMKSVREIPVKEAFTSSRKDQPAAAASAAEVEKDPQPALAESVSQAVSAEPEETKPEEKKPDTPIAPAKSMISRPGLQNETFKKPVPPDYAKEEALWQELVRTARDLPYVNDYPYSGCFGRAAIDNDLPIAVILALAGYLSNFEPAFSGGQRVGIMHLGWPYPARRMGVHQKDDLKDPCQNIDFASRFLADLLSKSDREWVPALVAYRDQLTVKRPAGITKRDLLFCARLRKQVEDVIAFPFEKKTMYPFWKFDRWTTAEEFIENIRKRTGVDLWLTQKGPGYLVYIPAINEKEKEKKAERIERETGIMVRPGSVTL